MSSLRRAAPASPAGQEAPTPIWGAVRRRGWIVPVAVVLVTGVAVLVSGLLPRQVVTESVVVVRSGSGATGPGAATEATRLAVTYASSIPDDAGLLYEAASRLGKTPEEISDAISVSVDPDTAVLRIRYSGPDESEAMRGGTAVLDALSSSSTRARSVPRRSLLVVQPPEVLSGGGSGSTIPVGLVLGIFLGLVVAIAWERADPRVDDAERLAATLGCPSIALSTLFPGGAAALLERWRALSTSRAPTIALLAGAAGFDESMPTVAERLRRLLVAGGARQVEVRDALAPDAAPGDEPDSPRGVLLLASGMPGRSAFADHAAAAADVVVVVVPQGGREAHVESVRDRLVQLSGKAPHWGLLVSRADLRAKPPFEDAGREPVISPPADPVLQLTSSRRHQR